MLPGLPRGWALCGVLCSLAYVHSRGGVCVCVCVCQEGERELEGGALRPPLSKLFLQPQVASQEPAPILSRDQDHFPLPAAPEMSEGLGESYLGRLMRPFRAWGGTSFLWERGWNGQLGRALGVLIYSLLALSG